MKTNKVEVNKTKRRTTATSTSRIRKIIKKKKQYVKHPDVMTTLGRGLTAIITSKAVYVKNTKHKGRGVFAARRIKEGELIEACPVLVYDDKDEEASSTLNFYYYCWGDDKIALCLGYGSLYNHSYGPNAIAKENHKRNTYDIIALRPIKKDEEICIDYTHGCKEKVWFDLPPEE